MRFSPLGDNAVTVSASDAADAINPSALAEALRHSAPPGVLDVVAAFESVTVFYNVALAGAQFTYDDVCHWIMQTHQQAEFTSDSVALSVIEIPVVYGGEQGPDLRSLAQAKGLKPAQLVQMHCSAEYTVLAVGFMPGFAYLGGLPLELHAPRLATPRTRVPAGSVGIGGSYSGVYPVETPGGWNVIGRTALKLFDPTAPDPATLHVGQKVRFVVAGMHD